MCLKVSVMQVKTEISLSLSSSQFYTVELDSIFCLSWRPPNEELIERSCNELEIYLRELACHLVTAFPSKLKGVLHSQEDGTNIFPSQLHNMSNYERFITNIHNFSKFSKTVQNLKKNFSASRP